MKALAVLVALLFAAPAHATLTQAQLSQVAVTLPEGARLDPALRVNDADGHTRTLAAITAARPAFVTFVDYTCNTLCGTDLMLLSAAIQRTHLKAGSYRLLVIGLDPKDPAAAARAMAAKEIPAAIRADTVLLLPDKPTLDRATGALGFHYAYDSATDQFAHPAAVFAMAPDGDVRAVFSPFALGIADLRTVLAAPQPLSLYDRIHMLCYGYDAATGLYTLRIALLLKLAAGLTLLLMAAALAVLIRKGRRIA